MTSGRLARIPRLAAWPLIIDILLLGICLIEALTVLYWADVPHAVVAFVAVAGISVRRRYPWVSVVLALPATALSLTTITPLIALYSLAVRERRPRFLAAAGAAAFVASLQPWWGFDGVELSFTALRVANGILFTAAPLALGLLVRTRADLSNRLRDLAAARQHERQLVYAEMLREERARIAREMHDVVSHQVSLIAVQAGALQVRSPDDETSGAAATIRGLAVRTLDELRQMVTVLKAASARTGGGPADENESLLPQPAVADIRDLVEASHPDAQLRVDVPALPAVFQRTLFRSVQEGLTNARKHAPGAPVRVDITTRGGLIVVTVENGRAAGEPMALPGSGHGLIGLRERAKLLGGDIRTDAGADGFRLTVTLPEPPPAAGGDVPSPP